MSPGGNQPNTTPPEAVELIRTMTLEGRSVKEIVAVVHCSERAVSRWRDRLGLIRHRPRKWDPSEIRLIENLLVDECPYLEIARTTGRRVDTIKRRWPGYGFKGSGNPIGGGRHRRMAEELGLTLT
jgi:hypothetical protein